MSVRDFLADLAAMAWSEFRQLTRNRAALLISLVVIPGFFVLALGSGFGGSSAARHSPVAPVRMAFVDNDRSRASVQLLDTLSRSGDFDNLVEGYNQQTAISDLGKGQIYAAIIVPDGFQNTLSEHQAPSIILYVDDSEPGLSDTLLSALSKDVQDFNLTHAAQVKTITKTRAISSFNVGLAVVVGVVQIFATFYEIAGGMSRAREEGTYARLLLTRTSIWSVLLAKTAYDSTLGILRTLLVLAVATFAYGAHPSTDIATIILLSLLIALMTMGFAFLVSAFGIGTRAVVILEFFLVLFIIGFSGLSVERELLAGVSRIISTVLPWSYGFDALRQTILIGVTLTNLSFDLEMVTASIVLFYLSAYVLLARARERLIQ